MIVNCVFVDLLKVRSSRFVVVVVVDLANLGNLTWLFQWMKLAQRVLEHQEHPVEAKASRFDRETVQLNLGRLSPVFTAAETTGFPELKGFPKSINRSFLTR